MKSVRLGDKLVSKYKENMSKNAQDISDRSNYTYWVGVLSNF
jgi:hypothetical protein